MDMQVSKIRIVAIIVSPYPKAKRTASISKKGLASDCAGSSTDIWRVE
jgi:hypothetical protein